MRVVCLDTVILIHAFKEMLPEVAYSEYERKMVARAKILIQNLETERARILIPCVVIAEYLMGIEPEKHDATLSRFMETFETPPFDVKAASIAARVWRAHRTLPKDEQQGRTMWKSDVLIIATAQAFGAREFFSHDIGSRQIAEQAGLAAFDLPEPSTPPSPGTEDDAASAEAR